MKGARRTGYRTHREVGNPHFSACNRLCA